MHLFHDESPAFPQALLKSEQLHVIILLIAVGDRDQAAPICSGILPLG